MSFVGGNGTQSNPYQISTVAQLDEVRNFLTSHFILMNDIDCTGYTGFLPIGTESTPFSGGFDGNSYKIKNLKINEPTLARVSLFGVIYECKYIRSLGLENVNITGDYLTAGLLSEQWHCDSSFVIQNCFVEGKITSNWGYVSGFACILNHGTVRDCYTDINIILNNTGEKACGFVSKVGENYSPSFINCISTSSVTGSTLISGFIGEVGAGSTPIVTECYFDSDVLGTTNSLHGIPKTTIQMKTQSTFAYDFTTIWDICPLENNGYPVLRGFARNVTGSGTEQDPYIIWTLKGLDLVRNDITAYYELGCNIDATDTKNWNNGDGWTPIGESGNTFKGNFDGKGYIIRNLYINASLEFAGLFGFVSNSYNDIKNIGLENVDITNTDPPDIENYTGSLLGKMISGAVENCYVTGKVTGNSSGFHYRGGFIGGASRSSGSGDIYPHIKNCYTMVSGIGLESGFIDTSLDWVSIKNCYSISKPTTFGFSGNSRDLYGGGIVDCYWDTQVSDISTSDGGTGLTTAQMKDSVSYANWDFTTIWRINPIINDGYPYLRVFENNSFAVNVSINATTVNVGANTVLPSFPYFSTTLDAPIASVSANVQSAIPFTGCYKKRISILGKSGAGTNYQMLIKVGESINATNYDFHLAQNSTDFPNDVFFSDTSDNMYDTWLERIEGVSPNRTAYIWVKIADNLDSNTNIYCSYGYTIQRVTYNAENVFDFYDDFTSTSLDTNKWTIFGGTVTEVANGGVTTQSGTDPSKLILSYPTTNANYRLRAKFKVLNNGCIDSDERIGLSVKTDASNGEGYTFVLHDFSARNQSQFLDDKKQWGDSFTVSWDFETYYTMDMFYDDTTSINYGRFNDGTWVTQSAFASRSTERFALNMGSLGAQATWEWVCVTKVLADEPTISNVEDITTTDIDVSASLLTSNVQLNLPQIVANKNINVSASSLTSNIQLNLSQIIASINISVSFPLLTLDVQSNLPLGIITSTSISVNTTKANTNIRVNMPQFVLGVSKSVDVSLIHANTIVNSPTLLIGVSANITPLVFSVNLMCNLASIQTTSNVLVQITPVASNIRINAPEIKTIRNLVVNIPIQIMSTLSQNPTIIASQNVKIYTSYLSTNAHVYLPYFNSNFNVHFPHEYFKLSFQPLSPYVYSTEGTKAQPNHCTINVKSNIASILACVNKEKTTSTIKAFAHAIKPHTTSYTNISKASINSYAPNIATFEGISVFPNTFISNVRSNLATIYATKTVSINSKFQVTITHNENIDVFTTRNRFIHSKPTILSANKLDSFIDLIDLKNATITPNSFNVISNIVLGRIQSEQTEYFGEITPNGVYLKSHITEIESLQTIQLKDTSLLNVPQLIEKDYPKEEFMLSISENGTLIINTARGEYIEWHS